MLLFVKLWSTIGMKRVRSGATVAAEFANAELGDRRLDKRLIDVVEALNASPKVGFPRALVTEAELEGFYRLLSNEKVTFESLLAPHQYATVRRIKAVKTALVVHDTSEFRFGGSTPREGLGRVNESGHGFMGHFALALSASGQRELLGLIGVHTWVRTKTSATQLRKQKLLPYKRSKGLDTEQQRWGDLVDSVEEQSDQPGALIHLMDSEADDYQLIAKLVDDKRRFVVRLCYDRRLDVEASNSAPHRKTKEFVATAKVVCKRKVTLSRRRRRPGGERTKRGAARKERKATLAFSATKAVFRRPSSANSDAPRQLSVNIVCARELKPPRNAEPVEWLLITTEPIETEKQILSVVDYYRSRWTIEEYFKALKSGCAYEKRQMESFKTLLNVLAIFIPIAWSMLRLRSLARSKAPASSALTPSQIEVLRHASTMHLPQKLSASDALLAIARLGGHLRNNGPPGWQILARGYSDLLMLEAGFRLGRQKM